MKTQKKIIDAYIVTIYKRNGVIDNTYKSKDVSRCSYIENDNGNYDIHYYQGGNCVHKQYEVSKETLLKSFEWKQSDIYSHVYTKEKMISKEIHYV
jgi:hypothetical protein